MWPLFAVALTALGLMAFLGTSEQVTGSYQEIDLQRYPSLDRYSYMDWRDTCIVIREIEGIHAQTGTVAGPDFRELKTRLDC